MTSSGVRDENDNQKRVIKGLIKNEEQFIQSLRVFANTSSLGGQGAPGSEISNKPVDATGNFLQKTGDLMIGQLGRNFDNTFPTFIEDGILDVSKTDGKTDPVIILQGEGGADDELVQIIQGEDVFPFQELVLRIRINTITLKETALPGNIATPNGEDLELVGDSIVFLYWDTLRQRWVVTVNSNTSSPVTFGGYLLARLSADQTPIAINEHVEFDVTEQSDSQLTVSTGVGQANGNFSGFIPGHVYECTAYVVGVANSGANRWVSARWYDNDKLTQFGTHAFSSENPSVQGEQNIANAYFMADENTTTIELRIINLNSVDTIQGGNMNDMPITVCTIVDVTSIGESGGAPPIIPPAYDTIERNNIPVTQRNVMNFNGDNFIVVDNPSETQTEITVKAGHRAWKKPVRAKPDGFTFLFPNIQQIIDGVTLVKGDRVLLTDELNPDNNGIWEVADNFSGIPLQAPLIRPDDFFFSSDVVSETFVAVEEGDDNAKKLYHLITPNPISIDIDNQIWEEFSPGGGYDTIEKDNVAVTQRKTMNFTGDDVSVIDNALNEQTEITIKAGSRSWKKPVRAKADGFTFLFPNIQQIIDGVTLAEGDRILLTDELNPARNGIYYVSGPFAGIPLQAPLMRPSDFFFDSDMVSESFVAVEEGNKNKESVWHLVTPNPIEAEVTDQEWKKFTGGRGKLVNYQLGVYDGSQYYVDTNKEYFGSFSEDVNVALPTSEPAGFTYSHTITAGDLPNGLNGWDAETYASYLSVIFDNAGAISTTWRWKGFVNGVEKTSIAGTRATNGQVWLKNLFYFRSEDLQVGDVIQAKFWADDPGITLDATAIFMIPKIMTTQFKRITRIDDPTGSAENIPETPTNIGTIDGITVTGFSEYYINDPFQSGNMVWAYSEGGQRTFYGENFYNVPNDGANRSSSNDRQIFLPGVEEFVFYQYEE